MSKYKKTYAEKEVMEVYDGPGGLLWEAVMSEQIHSGGPETTDELANALGLQKGMVVCDLCSALGAPARQIVKKYGVTVKGIDMTKTMIEKARARTKEAGLADKIEFHEGNVMDLPYEDESFDIVWAQEAWCYVTDKDKLIKEAYRVLKPGGKMGFTDWIITGEITEAELSPLYDTMSFPYMETFQGYQQLLKSNGFKILDAQDQTEAYAKCFDEYYDTVHVKLKPTIMENFGQDLFDFASNLVTIWRKAANEHKVGRGFFIAQK